jgi:hypothetical protein
MPTENVVCSIVGPRWLLSDYFPIGGLSLRPDLTLLLSAASPLPGLLALSAGLRAAYRQ